MFCYQIQIIFYQILNKMNNIQIKYPLAFAIDIDGTLVNSHHAIKYAKEGIDLLNQKGIPFTLVTNNVSKNQQTKADQISEILKPKIPFKKEQIILNSTPLKRYMKWQEQTILIVGRERKLCKMLPFQQIPNYLTIQQYCTIFPESVPLSARQNYQTEEQVSETKKRVMERLKIQKLNKHEFKFGAVLVINCPNRWQQCYQIIIDLLSSSDGSIPNFNEYKYVGDHIPIIIALNDLYFTTEGHNLPRLLLKPFTDGLMSVYKSVYNEELKVIRFGKPQQKTYDFTRRHMEQNYGKIQKIVMIGDNEDTDILGAFNAGWESIMVKTGVTKHNSKMATYNCEHILEGLQKYIQ